MRKKILFISDDIRGTSGVSHISRNIVTYTSDVFDWIQLSAMRNHPEQNSVVDVSQSVEQLTGNSNCYVRLYPMSGYGDDVTLRNLISMESPNAIFHMSDPRNFNWLYEMDYEIRNEIPLCYYHVWDNDPIPRFNKSVYESCDWIGCINRKTSEYVKELAPDTKSEYIPHGVSSEIFFKIKDTDELNQAKFNVFSDNANSYDFVIFSNNVNTPRKRLADLLLAVEELGKQHPFKNICLLCHVNPSSVPIYNLRKIAYEMCPSIEVIFTNTSLSQTDINKLYNVSDITINNSCNEGFGLSTLESLFTETPILATDTGGLSDQMRDDNGEIGAWAYPMKPDVRRINSGGDVLYIYEDLCSIETITTGLNYWINKTKDEINMCGTIGRNYALKYFSLDKMVTSIRDGLMTAMDLHTKETKNKLVKI